MKIILTMQHSILAWLFTKTNIFTHKAGFCCTLLFDANNGLAKSIKQQNSGAQSLQVARR
jgi:hypothetical protein